MNKEKKIEREVKKRLEEEEIKKEVEKRIGTKHPMALLCAFFLGIIAQMLKGHWKKAGVFFILNILSYTLWSVGIGVIGTFIMIVVIMSDAYYSNNPDKINFFGKEY